MPVYQDIYILSKERTYKTFTQFISRIIPYYEPSFELYDPKEIHGIDFDDLNGFYKIMCQNPFYKYAAYLRNLNDTTVKHGMIFFTDEGNIIFGVSINYVNDEKELEKNGLFWIDKMKQIAKAAHGYYTVEQPPEFKESEFIKHSI